MRRLYITVYLLYDHRYFKIVECWKYIFADMFIDIVQLLSVESFARVSKKKV